MSESFVRSYNLANEAFLYLTSINSSSCLSKAKIIIGDLDPACWWVPVEQIITFISKFRFFMMKVWHTLQKMSRRPRSDMWQKCQFCDKKRFLGSHGSVTSIKCWLDFGSFKSVTPQPASLHSNWPKMTKLFRRFFFQK